MLNFAAAQRKKSVLLPPSEAKKLTQPCSRPHAPDFDDTWVPTADDIKLMESKLSRISRLRAKCCMEGAQVRDLGHFYMQYVGIVVSGKKVIYISAFADDRPPEYWKQNAVTVCDGGVDWGVLYDPATQQFSDLAVNGIG
jgi:hypothetical protein